MKLRYAAEFPRLSDVSHKGGRKLELNVFNMSVSSVLQAHGRDRDQRLLHGGGP